MKNQHKMNHLAFWPAIIILFAFVVAGIFWTEQVGSIMTKLLYAMADFFGAYINLLSLVFIVLAVVFIIGRYGDVVIGGKDAKPEYSMFNWCAMSICSGIGTGLLFWAMGEPIYHYMTTPTAIAPPAAGEAGIFAVAQAMWDWSFVQYCMYAICGAAFAIICYNRKKSLNFNSIIECTTGKKTPWLNTLLTAIVIFCLMGATSNSMGVGLMQIGAGLEAAFGIPQSAIVWLFAAIFVTAIFVLSCVSGIGKGLKLVSSACIYFFFFLLAYVFIFGDTQFILKMTSESVGYIVDNFGTMTTMMNAMTENDQWFADWIVQYWASFIVYAPVIGMFLARMGAAAKSVHSCWCRFWFPPSFAWCGSVSSAARPSVCSIMAPWISGTQSIPVACRLRYSQIIGQLPLAKVITVMFLITVTLSFCTLADPMASVAATLSVDNVSAEDEPPRRQKILVGCMLGATAYTLVATGGIDSVKGMFTLVGLLQSIVLIMCAIVLFKYGKKCYYLKNSGYIDRCEDELSTAEQEEEAELLADVR